jgi:hypothetical protein
MKIKSKRVKNKCRKKIVKVPEEKKSKKTAEAEERAWFKGVGKRIDLNEWAGYIYR